jgi:hypothetical protein
VGTYVGPEVSYLDDFELELTLPVEYFTLMNPIIKKETFTSSFNPMWKVDVSDFTPPGQYYGQIRIKYYIGEIFAYDGPYNISFSVAATPLIIVPDTNDITVPTYIIDQKTT